MAGASGPIRPHANVSCRARTPYDTSVYKVLCSLFWAMRQVLCVPIEDVETQASLTRFWSSLGPVGTANCF